MSRAVRGHRTVLHIARRREASAERAGEDAAHPVSAVLVQPDGPGGGGGPVRLAGDSPFHWDRSG